ncbi:ABC transporter substrate-binding protein [Rhodococcus sp. SRB_17]|nr:ABC transporter substrate-binding protein [Rhodococcus sp. SRB_17]
MNPRRLFVALCAAATLLTSCGVDHAPDVTAQPSTAYTEPPLPAEVTIAPSPSPTTPSNCGDPTASLRPVPANAVPRPPTPNVDAIRERGRLIVGLDTGSNLMSFRAPSTGQLEGFDVDIAREVARDLFGDPDKIEYRILAADERITALQESTVDIVVKTLTINCERREKIEFSSQYFEAQQRIQVLKGSPIRNLDDLDGRRVCAVRGTTSLMRLQQVQPAAIAVTVPMWSDCLVLLQQGQVDAISTDDTLLAGLATQDPYLDVVGTPMGSEPYGIGIHLGNTDLVRFVNGTLDRIRADGTWNSLYDRWLSPLGPTPGPPPAVYRD